MHLGDEKVQLDRAMYDHALALASKTKKAQVPQVFPKVLAHFISFSAAAQVKLLRYTQIVKAFPVLPKAGATRVFLQSASSMFAIRLKHDLTSTAGVAEVSHVSSVFIAFCTKYEIFNVALSELAELLVDMYQLLVISHIVAMPRGEVKKYLACMIAGHAKATRISELTAGNLRDNLAMAICAIPATGGAMIEVAINLMIDKMGFSDPVRTDKLGGALLKLMDVSSKIKKGAAFLSFPSCHS